MAYQGLSKSRLLNHLQCPKRLYLQIHRPDLAEESAEVQQVFATGHQVGEVARNLVPNGILIGHDLELRKALAQTNDLLKTQPDRPLFEATFEHHGVLIRADLLLPNGSSHNLVEVKSSTGVKEQYLADCAVQVWVTESAGFPLEHVELAHIDTSFVYPGGEDYRGLLQHADITAEVRPLLAQVPTWVEEARRTLGGKEPMIAVGEQCHAPYECPFQNYCAGPQPEYPVTGLYRKGKIVNELLKEGIIDIRDIPPGRLTNATQERQRRVTVAGKAELNPDAGKSIQALDYPRYYLDFETIQFAVPVWPGTRPYQRLPFQWSCHIEQEDGAVTHEEFLGGLEGKAPMEKFAEKLIDTLNRNGAGPIFVYNAGFEGGCILDLANTYPDLAEELRAIRGRLVDLLPLTRESYYHPAMMGSWSIKAVLPTIAPELDYANLEEVQSAGMVQGAFMEIIDTATDPERRQRLIQSLRDYCGHDTLALVRLARFLTVADKNSA